MSGDIYDDGENPNPSRGPRSTAKYSKMSLRDYYAGQAIAGLLASEVQDTPEMLADVAYLISDAMIRRRAQK